MRKKLTAEQAAKSAERKSKFRGLVKQVADMSDEQRAQLTSRIGAVITCDGRALSLRNTMLCLLQCPTVSMVGGFRQWLNQGRAVRKGEHGAMIWIPTGKKSDAADGGESPETTADEIRFLVGTVFDIAQTEPVALDIAA